MKINVLAISILLLSGCDVDDRVRMKYIYDCKSDTTEQRQSFILQCISSANPKSDEEPEDWLTICQKMAEETICKKRKVTITYSCYDSFLGMCSTIWAEKTRVFND